MWKAKSEREVPSRLLFIVNKMEKWKRILFRIFRPGALVTVLLSLIAFPLLIFVFLREEESPLTYVAYVLSAYALTCICFYLPLWVKNGKTWLLSHRLAARYSQDAAFRATVSLWTGLFITLAFAVLKFVASCRERSVWLGALAAYYAVLAVIRFVILQGHRRAHETQEEKYRHALKIYRRCGFLMLILILAISGIALQMIRDREHYQYPGYMIYASAAFTFYNFIMAIVNAAKRNRFGDPIWSAAKLLGVSVALMSLFALQTGMFAVFGGEDDSVYAMNLMTGTAICAIILAIAVAMIVKGTKRLKQSSDSSC